MHLTLKKEATKPAAKNFLQQQARFDQFIDTFNRERPHQALNMRYPAELYCPSPRPYKGLPELEYPFHDRTITVTRCGRMTHLPGRPENQPLPGLRRSKSRRQTGRRPGVAGQLHAARSELLR